MISTQSKTLSAQAEFSGSVKDIVKKKGVNNVQIMVVADNDTTYYKPDLEGNFNFKNKAGKTKIYAISDDYVSEISSVNTTNGSKNKVNIAMVPKSGAYDYSKEKREEWKSTHSTSYAYMAKAVDRKACALPGIKPVKQSLGNTGAGVLTASEVNDFARYRSSSGFNTDQTADQKNTWGFVLDTRIPVQLKLDNNTPVVDATVRLLDSRGQALWTARTDNTGKAELWPMAFMQGELGDTIMSMDVNFGDEIFSFDISHNNPGIQTFTIQRPCAISDNLDIAFVIDATGSMGDEIRFIQNDLDTFIRKVADENKDINIRLGSVFYRDFGDAYVAKYSPFSSNSSIADNFILSQSASGGGDYPEALPSALQFACDSLEWSEIARARIMYLILDAGAHQDTASKNALRKYTEKAANKGIRIVPVICSGLTSSDAGLMRSIALATNGTNIFLNNLNPSGNPFIESSGDHYKIETLSELMTRITRQFSVVPECDNRISRQVIQITDSLLYTLNPNGDQDTGYLQLDSAEWTHRVDSLPSGDSSKPLQVVNIVHSFVTVFPNPTRGELNIRTSADIKIMYLADVTGKVLQQIRLNAEGITKVDLGLYSSGVYYLKYPTSRGWGAERILLQRN